MTQRAGNANASSIPVPPWIQGLRKDRRNFYIPAETPWKAGSPQLAKMGFENRVTLGCERACAVCGFPISGVSTPHRAFNEQDSFHPSLEDNYLLDEGGPGHRSCMIYSAFVCPYLASPQARLSKENTRAAGAPRGQVAVIFEFGNYDIALSPSVRDVAGLAEQQVYFKYTMPLRPLSYETPSSLRQELAAAIEEDSPNVDMTGPRLWWDDMQDPGLDSQFKTALDRMFKKGPKVRHVHRDALGHETEYNLWIPWG